MSEYVYECLCAAEKICKDNPNLQASHATPCIVWNERRRAEQDHTDFDVYGKWVESRWFSRPTNGQFQDERDLAIMSLGIAGEAGEVAEKMKKVLRDGTTDKQAILKELGDVIFYAVKIGNYFGFRPSQILAANVEKIEGRTARGTRRGSGDDR